VRDRFSVWGAYPGFDYHHYRKLLAEATDEPTLIDRLRRGLGTNWRKKSRVKMLSIVRPSGFCDQRLKS
jgi:hypothetical protein